MSAETVEKELASFLNPDTSTELKVVATENVLGFTGTQEGKQLLRNSDILLKGVTSLILDSVEVVKTNALKTLINLAADDDISWKILSLSKSMVCHLLESSLNSSNVHADLELSFLSNITRSEKCADFFVKECVLPEKCCGLDKLVQTICVIQHNKNANLDYLSALLCNLSQVRALRQRLMDSEKALIQRLLPFIQYMESDVRRASIVGTIKNCCFDTEFHDWLLGESVDILPRLLLPLAGPEEFDDDDMDKLPNDLQYLPPDKTREPVPHIRKMILQAIFQLCATKTGRTFIKSKNAYVIIREYHKWEQDHCPNNETDIMNVIDILIQDEPPPSMENLKEVDIPADVLEEFQKIEEHSKEENK